MADPVSPPTPGTAHASVGAPSPWLLRWQHLLPAGGQVLDLACGSGRHVQYLAAMGFAVLGVDRDAQTLAALAGTARTLVADLEGAEWPLEGQCFDAVVVTNYLWRPRWAELRRCLAPGGVLLYETFAIGQQTVGRPSRPEFLLQPGELLQLAAGLQVVAYENGFLDEPARFVQRLVAIRPLDPGSAEPARHPLSG